MIVGLGSVPGVFCTLAAVFPPRFLICWYLFGLPEEDSVKQCCKRWVHAAKD